MEIQKPGAVTTLTSAYWPGDNSESILETTIGDLLVDAARDAPDVLALIGVGGERSTWTYEQVLHDAELIARSLLQRFEPGERVAVWAQNLPQWSLLEFGAALAGITIVTVNPAFRPSELAYVLGQSRSAGIFLVPRFRSPMLEFLEKVRPELPDLREVTLFSEWNRFMQSASQQQRLPRVLADDSAQIQYTSGTTGFPKGAVLHHRGLTNVGRFYARLLDSRPSEVWANWMPMFHTAGCVLASLGAVAGRATLVQVEAFDPALALDVVQSEHVNLFLSVPTMLVAMLEHQLTVRRNVSSVRCVISGGSVVPAELVRKVESVFDCNFTIVFGMTECSPLVTMTRLDDTAQDKAETLGRPMPQTEVKIVSPLDGETVPVGQVGEMCTRGYMVMKGYFENPEATKQAIDREGWYHTGDLASMNSRGYCRIEGRLREMIIRGGENIYPREIEEVLFDHPKIAEAAVVGIPDERWGELVAAFIRLAPGEAEPAEEELRSWCRERLSPFKTPMRWIFVDVFPVTPSGKIQKFVLRDRLIEEQRSGVSADTLRASSSGGSQT